MSAASYSQQAWLELIEKIFYSQTWFKFLQLTTRLQISSRIMPHFTDLMQFNEASKFDET